MAYNKGISASALAEVLNYLKRNPSMVKFDNGGEYPPYLFSDPSQGDINAVSPMDYSSPLFPNEFQNTFGQGFDQYEISPNMGVSLDGGDPFLDYLMSLKKSELSRFNKEYIRDAGAIPGLNITKTWTNSSDAPDSPISGWDRKNREAGIGNNLNITKTWSIDNPDMPDDRWDKRQIREQGQGIYNGALYSDYGSEYPYFDPVRRAERQSERSQGRIERQERRDIRQFNRMNDKDPQGMFSSDEFRNPEGRELVWRENTGQLPEGMKGDWYVPSAKEERKAERKERMNNFMGSDKAFNALAGISAVGHLVGGLFGTARDAMGVVGSMKRNRYMEDWYRQQLQKERNKFTPISQTANANYLGGMSYGEHGGEMGISLPVLQYGDIMTSTPDNGDEPKELTKKEREELERFSVINTLRGYYRHLDPSTQNVIDPGVIDFGGKKTFKNEGGKYVDVKREVDKKTGAVSYRIGTTSPFEVDMDKALDSGIHLGDNDNVMIVFRDNPKYGSMPVVVGTGDKSDKWAREFNKTHASFVEGKRGQLGAYYDLAPRDQKPDEVVKRYMDWRAELGEFGSGTSNEVPATETTVPTQRYGGLFKSVTSFMGGGEYHTMPDGTKMPGAEHGMADNPHFQEGQYIEFEYGGKMYKGTIARNSNGKIYLK